MNGSRPALCPRPAEEVTLVSLLPALIVVAITLGLISAVVDGLLFLPFIGTVPLVAAASRRDAPVARRACPAHMGR
ncbi:hypothetical protein GCM10010299_40540 [Streptomyces tanashiensis]|nr:hypothetical protein GCM10010299_40540 [Streptomyces tanashiensis]